ncbi:hypothetical protein DPMN_056975 [Dreissena polymorpha]|uniref:DED domain-containing protein n=2 Tax=Dreissena polymorpha TaxID=45954 RepID=A0A9D4CUR0_DREPO|nr:hypothetical protein DPMN_056975 [Dreissena polymorpha]
MGPAGRASLRRSQPFTALMLEVSFALTDNEVSALKLALRCDGQSTKRAIYAMKNAHDVVHVMRDLDLVNEVNTDYLEHLLCQCGRKDLMLKIRHYHDKRLEHSQQQTTVKQPVSPPGSFTQLKSYRVQEVTDESRGAPSGASMLRTRSRSCSEGIMEGSELTWVDDLSKQAVQNVDQLACFIRDHATSLKRVGLQSDLDLPDELGNIYEAGPVASVSNEKKEILCCNSLSCSQKSQMSIDLSQSQGSQMSISDDE